MELTDLAPDVLIGMGAFNARIASVSEDDPPVISMYVEESADPEQIDTVIERTFDDLTNWAIEIENVWAVWYTAEEAQESDEAAWARCHIFCDPPSEAAPEGSCGVIGNSSDLLPRPCPPLLSGDEELETHFMDYRYIWRFGQLADESIRSVRMYPPTVRTRPN